jgi:uncharacterized membrane protein YdfJ with MMPL/SSD domain
MYIAIRYKKMTNSHKGGAVMNMVAFGKKVVKFRIPILIISILLLIPAGLGYVNTRVNYDVLTYLPEDIETMQGQDILVKDFGTGAFSMFIVDGMEDKEVSALKAKIENVEHVQKVLWYDSLADISMPKSMIPKDVYEVFNADTVHDGDTETPTKTIAKSTPSFLHFISSTSHFFLSVYP